MDYIVDGDNFKIVPSKEDSIYMREIYEIIIDDFWRMQYIVRNFSE